MSERSEVGGPQRWQYALIIALCVIGTVLGVWLAATHPTQPAHHHHGVVFPVVFAVVGSMVVSAFGVFMLRRVQRRPAMQALRNTGMAQRRATSRAIQMHQPLTEEQHGIAEAQLANLTSSRRRMLWLLPASIVSLIVAAVLGHGGLRVLLIVLVVCEVVSALALLVLQRLMQGRYRRALARPSDQD